MLKEVWGFFKYPTNIQLQPSTAEKKQMFTWLLLLAVSFSIFFGIFIEGISYLFNLDFGSHAAEELFNEFSTLAIFVLAVIFAPVIEELLFRGPLTLFKNPIYFKYAFYSSILLFGIIHITNFENINGQYWAVPVLVLPQLCAGVFFGFIRVKLGLLWSMLLHAAHNLVLIGPVIILKLLDIPLE